MMFNKSNFALILIIGFLLSACQSATTLILLPDESGKVGAITVKANNEVRLIDKAYHSVSTNIYNNDLTETTALDKTQVNQDYAALMKAQPAHATSIYLYFSSGSTELVQESVAKIPMVLNKIKENMPTEISVIGHTDTTGSDSINNKLSKNRALAVAKILKEKMPSLSNITVQSFGSKDLLVATPANVDELRNRRVEVLIP
jgi:outer membrane protein OmpA-like peptidoglycan-associated protein